MTGLQYCRYLFYRIVLPTAYDKMIKQAFINESGENRHAVTPAVAIIVEKMQTSRQRHTPREMPRENR
ncbi:MAG: hypothetical protein L6Q60_04080 [Rhodocyclaceae bacterium]|nr:hypothetical protein [Rhodocyclaceae bacterium]